MGLKLKEKILRYLKRLLGVHSPSRWGEIILQNNTREKNHSYYEKQSFYFKEDIFCLERLEEEKLNEILNLKN